MPGTVAAVVLAAGEASRFGAPKQNLLLPRVLRRVVQPALADIVVVEGAHAIDVDLPPRVRLVECSQWADGPGASLRCGLNALGPATGAALVILADGPRLDARAVRRVIDAWRAGFCPVPAVSTWPKMTSSTSLASTPVRSSSPAMAVAPS